MNEMNSSVGVGASLGMEDTNSSAKNMGIKRITIITSVPGLHYETRLS